MSRCSSCVQPARGGWCRRPRRRAGGALLADEWCCSLESGKWQFLPRVLDEELGRREARGITVVELFQFLDDGVGAQVVDIAEGAAAERWKPESHDGPNVAVACRANDAVFEAPH